MRPIPFAALALFVSASACNSLLGIDGDYGPLGDGATGGTGGNGGTNTGTGLGPGPGAGPPSPLGEICANDEGCAEGVCGADGVCCTEECDADCYSCLEQETGEPDGMCAPLLDGTDECNGPPSCIQGQCALKPNGLDCNAANECVETCNPEGICCDAPCNGPCESCVEALTGMPQGTCALVLAGMRPPGSCMADEACDGNGACKTVQGAPCTVNPPDQCITGQCVDGVCCDSACDQLCEACAFSITTEPDGLCSPIPADEDPENECAMACDGAGMCQ